MTTMNLERAIIETRLKVMKEMEELHEQSASLREYEDLMLEPGYQHVLTLGEFAETLRMLKALSDRIHGHDLT